uniref:PDZ domain-containing protein n=1 Tax=Eutreptiella gymnastica TaxID=73025 RepID=A0A7S1NAJ4_9EUGL|mmetsp:Transcript_146484/g.255877  ORF Transcript_146484/g.255877 Transcript_146484/m.255877 type:complete len:254 (+) Transcript_146484:85-846(+)
MVNHSESEFAQTIWKLSNSNKLDSDDDLPPESRLPTEYANTADDRLARELKQSRREVTVLAKELKAAKLQVKERKAATAARAQSLTEVLAEIERLRKCEEVWLQDLEQQLMRPIIGVEVHEQNHPNGSVSLTVTAVAQKGTAHKAGVQIGDVVTRFGKAEINSKADFARALLGTQIGSKQIMLVVRQNVSPSGKPCTSVDKIHITVAGALPTGLNIEVLRNSADPAGLVQKCKQEGARAIARMIAAETLGPLK